MNLMVWELIPESRMLFLADNNNFYFPVEVVLNLTGTIVYL